MEIAVCGAGLEMPHAALALSRSDGGGRGQWWDNVSSLPSCGTFHAAAYDNDELRRAIRNAGLMQGRWSPRIHMLYDRPMRARILTLWLIWRHTPHPLSWLPREVLVFLCAFVSRNLGDGPVSVPDAPRRRKRWSNRNN